MDNKSTKTFPELFRTSDTHTQTYKTPRPGGHMHTRLSTPIKTNYFKLENPTQSSIVLSVSVPLRPPRCLWWSSEFVLHWKQSQHLLHLSCFLLKLVINSNNYTNFSNKHDRYRTVQLLECFVLSLIQNKSPKNNNVTWTLMYCGTRTDAVTNDEISSLGLFKYM